MLIIFIEEHLAVPAGGHPVQVRNVSLSLDRLSKLFAYTRSMAGWKRQFTINCLCNRVRCCINHVTTLAVLSRAGCCPVGAIHLGYIKANTVQVEYLVESRENL